MSRLSATYTVLYSETDPSALAKYRLWKSVGFVVTYSVSDSPFSQMEEANLVCSTPATSTCACR